MCVCGGGGGGEDLGTRLGLSLIGQRSTICIKTEIQHFILKLIILVSCYTVKVLY